jgi:SAM-dependent methyltransferase
MLPATERFTNRVADYVKYRPGYPPEVLAALRDECGLTSAHTIADIGCGTGLLTEIFLRNGNAVIGVEPNDAMRLAGENYLRDFNNFTSVNATAEHTTLPGESLDVVVAGQAFHWFDADKTRAEFRRILRPSGFAVLIWNERRKTATEFLIALESLLQTFTTDRPTLDLEVDEPAIEKFFAPDSYRLRSFDNRQTLDYEGLQGRFLSASYVPEAGHPNRPPMLRDLRRIFNTHAVNNTITIEYDTRIFVGNLAARAA